MMFRIGSMGRKLQDVSIMTQNTHSVAWVSRILDLPECIFLRKCDLVKGIKDLFINSG